MLFVCMPPRMHVERMVSAIYRPASSSASTNLWYFSFFLWTLVVGSQTWQEGNSMNYQLEFWVVANI